MGVKVHDGVKLVSADGLTTTVLTTTDAGKLSIPNGIDLTSGQIKFPATQVASSDANTLDDYEEGTWTPILIGGTSTGVGTYTAQEANYIKIGKSVYLRMYINITNHTGTGVMKITGVPFRAIGHCGLSICYLNRLTFSGTPTAWIPAYETNIYLENGVSGSSSSGISMDVDFGIMVCGTYQTD